MSAGVDAPLSNQAKTARFGTFGGVFTPNVLTILGIILFLRTGWVLGRGQDSFVASDSQRGRARADRAPSTGIAGFCACER
jgi:hypothetical protein